MRAGLVTFYEAMRSAVLQFENSPTRFRENEFYYFPRALLFAREHPMSLPLNEAIASSSYITFLSRRYWQVCNVARLKHVNKVIKVRRVTNVRYKIKCDWILNNQIQRITNLR